MKHSLHFILNKEVLYEVCFLVNTSVVSVTNVSCRTNGSFQ